MIKCFVPVTLLSCCMLILRALSSTPPHCPLYQAITSTGGVGVFAGERFVKDDLVEFAPTFYTSPEAYSNNIVGDYVMNHNDSHGSLHGGYSLVMNHCDRPNMGYPDVSNWMKAKRNISKGEELCIDYGKAWWKLRGYTKLQPMDLERDEGEEAFIIPGCPQLLTELLPIGENKNESEMKDVEKEMFITSSWKKDDMIEGNFRNEGDWYRGKIESKNVNGTYDILYDDGDVEKYVPKEFIRPAKTLEPPTYMKVVASMDISAGTTIEVSRSLIVPRRFWDDDQYNLEDDEYPNDIKYRIWRILNDNTNSIGLLNYGMGSYYRAVSNSSRNDLDMLDHNHVASNASISNVLYREYKGPRGWKDDSARACVPATLIEFIATQDIAKGTELVIDMDIDVDASRFGERISRVRLDEKCVDHFISFYQKVMLNGTSYHPLLRRASFESKDVKNATLFWVNPGIPPDHNNTQNTTVLERWGDLNVGEVIRVNTYVGHRWIVQINGSAIQEWRISEDAAYKHDVLRFELYQEDIDDNNDSDDAIEDVKSEL